MIALWQTLIERFLSWPVVIFCLALIFKNPVTQFIESIDLLKWKAGGGEVEFSRKANQQSEAAERTPKDPLALSSGEQQLRLPLAEDIAQRRETVKGFGGNNAAVLIQIDALKADFDKLHFQLNEPETTEILIRHLAVTQLYQRAEFLYRLIFGSQMAAMEKMNWSGPLEVSEVMPFFERARKRSPRFYGDTSFERWVGFLVTQGVVGFSDGRYGISIFGREFLNFVVEQGLPRKAH